MHGNWCSRSLSNNFLSQLNKCSTHTVLMHGNWCSRFFLNNIFSAHLNRAYSHLVAISISLILHFNQMAQNP